MNNEKPLSEYTWEQLLEYREKFVTQQEEIEAGLDVLKKEMLIRLQEENVNGKVVGNYAITKATRVSFKTPIDEAEALGAIKKTVDTAALKKLYNDGIQISGVEKTEYVTVREVEKKNDSA